MAISNKLDIIVYGATGYTGKLICEYLQKHYPHGDQLSWGIAGRNRNKLETLRAELGTGSRPVFVADCEDQASLDTIASNGKVILNSAGPYSQYGAGVVASCIRHGTDYVDLNGEPLWMHDMLARHEEGARASGSRIVFSCGFDSVPSDLGLQYLQEAAIARFGNPLTRVKCRVKALKGYASGGTVASLQTTINTARSDVAKLEVLKNAFALTPGFAGPKQPSGNKKVFEEDLNRWSGPFVMATINTKNIHRSNYLLGHPYGKELVYDEMVFLDEADDGHAVDNGFDMSTDLKPGDGPTPEQRRSGFYELWILGSNTNGQSLNTVVTGDQDPGYGSTAKMVAESAVCLSQIPKTNNGGILTPASAMGRILRERLEDRAGLTFSILPAELLHAQ